MSNIYIQEPPTEGKVLLETTVGDIDIELWSREAPKACRNFIQLCMEGYYDKTVFHRLVKGFIVQGGDPTGTGSGGASIWGKPFKDEVHSRLRFVRRGLVGMANAGRDDNSSQFFFTLGPTPELQNKHTIFGKVGGNTIYNMIKLEDGELDENERPRYPHKILKTKILNNPFEDIVPRASIKSLGRGDEKNKSKSTASATKNYSLLSFGIEAEEEEEEIDSLNERFSAKGKSSHDLTSDPKLSSEAVEVDPTKKRDKDKPTKQESESDKEQNSEDDSLPAAELASGSGLTVSSVKEKLSAAKASSSKGKTDDKKSTKSSKSKKEAGESSEEEYYLGKDDKDAEKLRLESIRKEYRALKRSMKTEKEENKKKEVEVEASSAKDNEALETYFQEQAVYKEKRKAGAKKGDDREAVTLALLAKFKNKIESAKESAPEEALAAPESKSDKVEVKGMLYEGEEDYDPSDTSWLAKSLHRDGAAEAVLAKDANRKADDWYEIYDPKNPLNRRRREESKRAEGEKWKKFKPTD